MTRWTDEFTAGAFSGSPIGTGDYTEGGLSPERSIQYLSFAAVSEDAAVKAAIASMALEIECTTLRNPQEFRALPRVQCYLGSLAGEMAPTQISVDEVRVYWAIRMAWDEAMGNLAFGEPSFDSLMRLIRTALMVNHQLTFDVAGQACPLATRSNQDGEMNYLLDYDESSGRGALTVELPWLYRVKVDTQGGGLEALS